MSEAAIVQHQLRSTAMIPFAERKALSEVAFSSLLFAGQTKDQLFLKIQAGAEMGIPPFAALRGLFFQGERVSMSGDLMATLIKQSARYTYRIKEMNAQVCCLEFLERFGEEWRLVGESTFTMKDAELAELTTGRNKHSYKKYPRNMLFNRAMSNGYRWYCPDLTCGCPWYVPEEVGPISDDGSPAIDAEIVTEPADVVPQEVITELEELARSVGANIEAIKHHYKVSRLEQMSSADVEHLKNTLNTRERVEHAENSRGTVPGQGGEVGNCTAGQ